MRGLRIGPRSVLVAPAAYNDDIHLGADHDDEYASKLDNVDRGDRSAVLSSLIDNLGLVRGCRGGRELLPVQSDERGSDDLLNRRLSENHAIRTQSGRRTRFRADRTHYCSPCWPNSVEGEFDSKVVC